MLIFYNAPVLAKGKAEITFNLGPSLNQSGNIKALGEPNLSTGFGFNYYINPKHGLGLGYNNESSFDGSTSIPQISDSSITSFDIHYVYRHMIDRFHIVFEPGFGQQTLYYQTTDYYWGFLYNRDASTAFLLNYKFFLRYVVTGIGDGEDVGGQFFVGTGIVHNFSLDDELKGRDISGNRMALLFQLGLGW
jgi:hypothetical protein